MLATPFERNGKFNFTIMRVSKKILKELKFYLMVIRVTRAEKILIFSSILALKRDKRSQR